MSDTIRRSSTTRNDEYKRAVRASKAARTTKRDTRNIELSYLLVKVADETPQSL